MIRKPNPNWFENFRKVQKEGELMCAWCYVVFTHDGYPCPTSWVCSEHCYNLGEWKFKDLVPQDTPSRLYLIDLESTIKLLDPGIYDNFKEEVKNEEKK